MPTTVVRTVTGIPNRAYSQNPISTRFLADSTTMMFATEPTIVRFPANVVASAITFHISSGWAKLLIHFPATKTNGTLEKMFEPTTENQARFHACRVLDVPKTLRTA